jgi:hypothetical protein
VNLTTVLPFLRALTVTVLPDLILEADSLTIPFLEEETLISLLYVFDGYRVALILTEAPFFFRVVVFLAEIFSFVAFCCLTTTLHLAYLLLPSLALTVI